ncbi:lytic murein transglycosylase [bacterium]|nr:lytic murein transglycosylase [bacterium]
MKKPLLLLPLLLGILLGTTTLSAQQPLLSGKAAPWEHLAQYLVDRGIAPEKIRSLFHDSRMPPFSFVPYAVRPREPKRIYQQFLHPKRIVRAKQYLKTHQPYFKQAEHRHSIPEELIVAILLVETDLGRYTGNSPILPRLARLANAGSPENWTKNYRRLAEDEPGTTKEEVFERGQYLLELFGPEVEAALRIAEQRGYHPFAIKGSHAGAFGYAQFLPTSFERFAQDGNGDGVISLFQHPDAILSIGNFLRSHAPSLPKKHKDTELLRKAVYAYNRSEPYVDAVLGVANRVGLKLPWSPPSSTTR